MTTSTVPANEDLRNKYVARLRGRLARPTISVADARDGMLDCYVSTYHVGVEQGLKGILGVDASPDQVAQVATKMFRDRLDALGSSFEAPSAEALGQLKDEVDTEFHFSELPAEVSATHDQVCSLLLAKADGLLDHHGDRSVVTPSKTPRPPSAPVASPPPPPPMHDQTGTSAFNPTALPTPAGSRAASSVTASLRQALAAHLQTLAQQVDGKAPADLLADLRRATNLAQSIEDFESA